MLCLCDKLYVHSQNCMLVGIKYGINGCRYIVAMNWQKVPHHVT